MNPINPLTQEHCDCLNRVLESTAATQDYIKKCKDCGIEVGPAEEMNTLQRSQAEKIKATFFPHQS